MSLKENDIYIENLIEAYEEAKEKLQEIEKELKDFGIEVPDNEPLVSDELLKGLDRIDQAIDKCNGE